MMWIYCADVLQKLETVFAWVYFDPRHWRWLGCSRQRSDLF